MSDLPEGWANMTLAEVGRWGSGGTPKASMPSYYGGDIPWIRSGDLPDGLIVEHEITLTDPGIENSAAKWVSGGAVLIAMYGATIGKLGITTYPVTTNQAVAFIEPSSGVEARYLFENLRFRKPDLVALGQGGAQPNVSQEILKVQAFPLAPLHEQRRIVAKIDSLTGKSRRARDHLDHIPRLVEKYKQAILAAAFRGDLTREWRETNELPSLQTARLPELLAEPIRNGLSVRGSDTPPGVRALRLSALRGGKVDLSDVRFLPITDDQSARFLLRKGDVLVSRGNGTKAFVGLAALVGTVEFSTIFPDTAFRLRPAPSIASPIWLAFIWNAPPMREQIERAAKTTAGIWKISQGNLNEIDILLPSPDEQAEIVRRIESAFVWIDRLFADATSARKLINHLERAVLAKAFKGELVPQDPADEPASILLERIRAERATAPKAKRGHKKAA